MVKTARVFWGDLRERAVSTFWQAFLASLLMAQPASDWSQPNKVVAAGLVAGLAAVLSMAKSIVVRNRGIKNSASSSKNV